MKFVLIQQATHGVDVSTSTLIAFPPQSVSGSTAINGQIIDRLNYREAIFTLAWAAVSGAPTGATFALIVQHGNVNTLSDAATLFTLETALNVYTAAGSKEYHLNLQSANRYLRIVLTPTYTGGTTPANITAGDMIMGGAVVDPVPTLGASAATVFGA